MPASRIPYEPTGEPMVDGERPEPALPPVTSQNAAPASNVVPLPARADISRASDEDAAYKELIAFIAANKDDDTACSFLPVAEFSEGR